MSDNIGDGAANPSGNSTTPTDAAKLWLQIKHFDPCEFDDPTAPGSGLGMNIEFVKILDAIRDECNEPLNIDSGFRTKDHNAAVGGKDDSAHMRGAAADISCLTSQMRFNIVVAALKNGIKRIGLGDGFVHLDLEYTLPQAVIFLYPPKATAVNQNPKEAA